MILLCLLLTLILESAVLLVCKERALLTHLFFTAMNVSTNLTANLILHAVAPIGVAYTVFAVIAEVLIIAVEAILIYLYTRSCRKAWLYALLCNAVSYIAGTLILYFIW